MSTVPVWHVEKFRSVVAEDRYAVYTRSENPKHGIPVKQFVDPFRSLELTERLACCYNLLRELSLDELRVVEQEVGVLTGLVRRPKQSEALARLDARPTPQVTLRVRAKRIGG